MLSESQTDENERLSILGALNLLNDNVEPDLDAIIHLGARALGVPMVMATFVDMQWVWAKSCMGIGNARFPRENTLCTLVMQANGPLVIPDTLLDPRAVSHPMAAPEGLRFYAGTPIRSSTGICLGCLCIMDRQPRALPPASVSLLIDLADVISHNLMLRKMATHATEQRETEHKARAQAEARFHEIFDCAGEGIALLTPDENWLQVNSAFCEIVGYSQAELKSRSLAEITYSADIDQDRHLRNQIRSGAINHYEREKRYVRKDGATIWIQVTVTAKKDASGRLEYYIAIITDIQARKTAEEALQALKSSLEEQVASRTEDLTRTNAELLATVTRQKQTQAIIRKREAELQMVLECASDAYVSIDTDGIVRAWNLESERAFGWSREEAIGHTLTELIIPESHHAAHLQGIRRYLQSGKSEMINQRLELMARHRKGHLIPVEVRIRALHNEDNVLFSAFLNDISERKQREAEREREARHDALTGLQNRRALFEVLPKAIARVTRSDKSLALLFIDLDGFKPINDRFGHSAGDALLAEIAARLNISIRQTDQAFRLGGDEFTILLEDLAQGLKDAQTIAGTLLEAIMEPYAVDGQTVRISASIGLGIHTPSDPPCSADELITQADTAMYQAKHDGKSRICVAKSGL